MSFERDFKYFLENSEKNFKSVSVVSIKPHIDSVSDMQTTDFKYMKKLAAQKSTHKDIPYKKLKKESNQFVSEQLAQIRALLATQSN